MSKKSYGLGIHTTTKELGLAISNCVDDSRTQVWNLGYDLSSYLHEYLTKFVYPLTWQDLALIAVAKGPGGFTGTRIGMVTARTLGQQLNIPVFAISTLAAIAWSKQIQGTIAVQMTARRGQLFVGIYEVSVNNIEVSFPETTITPETWQKTLDNWHKNYHLTEASASLGYSVNSILELAWIQWQQEQITQWWEALPFYGQQPVN